MSDIEKVLSMDIKNGIIFIAALVIVAVFVIQKWDWIISRFGITTKKQKHEDEQTNDIELLKNHAKKTDQNIDKILCSMDDLNGSVNNVSTQVKLMQEKIDATDRSRLKDRIGESYRYYNEKKEWSLMERDAFNDLIQSYEAAGGANSFVHTICVPESLTWKIIR